MGLAHDSFLRIKELDGGEKNIFRCPARFINGERSGGSIESVAVDHQEVGKAGKIAGNSDKFKGGQKVQKGVCSLASGDAK